MKKYDLKMETEKGRNYRENNRKAVGREWSSLSRDKDAREAQNTLLSRAAIGLWHDRHSR